MVNMAESKGSLLAKSVQKHAGRAKEKVSASWQSQYIYVSKRKNLGNQVLFVLAGLYF